MLLKTAVDLARQVAMLYGLKENLQQKELVFYHLTHIHSLL